MSRSPRQARRPCWRPTPGTSGRTSLPSSAATPAWCCSSTTYTTYKDLTAQGVEFTGEPFSDQGGTFVGVKDPWATVLVLADNKRW